MFRSMNTTEEANGASLAANWPGDDLDLLIVIATSLILILMILTTIVGGSYHHHFHHHGRVGECHQCHCYEGRLGWILTVHKAQSKVSEKKIRKTFPGAIPN